MVTDIQHEAYFRGKKHTGGLNCEIDKQIHHTGPADEKMVWCLASLSGHHCNITTLSECKSPEKQKELYLLLVGCCCYYHLVSGLRGIF